MPVAFDEMTMPDGGIRPAYAHLGAWLKDLPPEMLEQRRREAELMFRRIGITFALYGENETTERVIPFDVLPRIMGSSVAGEFVDTLIFCSIAASVIGISDVGMFVNYVAVGFLYKTLVEFLFVPVTAAAIGWIK